MFNKRNAVLMGLVIISIGFGTLLYKSSLVHSAPAACDSFYMGDDGGIWGKNVDSNQCGQILKPGGKWLWRKRLKNDYEEEWQVLSSSAFYDELTPCLSTGKLYVVSVWSKDGGNANAAVLIELNTDGSEMKVIADHVDPYPPKDKFFELSSDGHFLKYYDDEGRVWQYNTAANTKSLVPLSIQN